MKMALKTILIGCSILVVFCFIQGVQSEEYESSTCRYIGLCLRRIGIIRDLDLCFKTESCVTTWGSWGRCFGIFGGYRKRIGRCVGKRCRRLVWQKEDCNPNPPPPPPSVDGMWSSWGSWTDGQCSVSCCGGTRSRTRSRTCTNPPPAGDGSTCAGSSTETQTGITCNEQECPLSCSNVAVGTIFNEPCEVCSRNFRACAGAEQPVQQMCPGVEVWSPMNNECQENCDPA